MSDKKYYVKSLISCEPYTSDADKGWLTSASNDSATWIYKKYRTAFTKSELGKIMGGAIYKGCILPDGHEFSSDCKPWINPLIELVPVEEGK
ncbi:hypothetical protein [Lactococcus lactis]|uniref:hypothetical protein n=1 Tax=Lactococcus lactis TaxID=1358 RepID=UPI0020791771|nr:hypothetical protein [Lactococcus lactis]MCT0445193.1 hypothetical protein [Lactococcus lactis subsp. lactis]MDM7534753.1 hypothetical protein [Lactococcus lactis]USI62677.1 hypothetical protein LO769_09730 [Lactococcus lactis subsp. lactis]